METQSSRAYYLLTEMLRARIEKQAFQYIMMGRLDMHFRKIELRFLFLNVYQNITRWVNYLNRRHGPLKVVHSQPREMLQYIARGLFWMTTKKHKKTKGEIENGNSSGFNSVTLLLKKNLYILKFTRYKYSFWF